MAKIYKSDIVNVNKETVEYLETVITNENAIINKLRKMIYLCGLRLSGDSCEKMINRLSLYLDAYKKQRKIANLLLDNIKYSNTHMKAYIGFHDVVDDSKVDELKNTLNTILREMDSLDSEQSEKLINSFKILSLKMQINYLSKLKEKDSECSSYLDDISIDVHNYKNAIIDIETINIPDGFEL